MSLLALRRDDHTYTRCYCEENIYMLCKRIAEQDPNALAQCTVVFISNPNRTVCSRQNKQ